MYEIEELIEKIDSFLREGFFQTGKTIEYKNLKHKYNLKEIERLASKIIENLTDSKKAEELKKTLEKKDFSSFLKAKEILLSLKEEEQRKDMKLELPKLPKEIEQEIKKNFFEIETCFKNSCYRSVLILCGKILEIALHRKYFEITSKDLLEKAPDIGLGNLIKKLKEEGFDTDPGLNNQIHLINQLRIHSVHKKTKPFDPSREQALATILYTLDILKKLFG